MSGVNPVARRSMLKAAMAGTSGIIAGTVLYNSGDCAKAAAHAQDADARIRGPFLIPSTRFTEPGAVDYDSLARRARYVDWCGCTGMIWPQSGDGVDLLIADEKLQGMEVLAETSRGLNTTAF